MDKFNVRLIDVESDIVANKTDVGVLKKNEIEIRK